VAVLLERPPPPVRADQILLGANHRMVFTPVKTSCEPPVGMMQRGVWKIRRLPFVLQASQEVAAPQGGDERAKQALLRRSDKTGILPATF